MIKMLFDYGHLRYRVVSEISTTVFVGKLPLPIWEMTIYDGHVFGTQSDR